MYTHVVPVERDLIGVDIPHDEISRPDEDGEQAEDTRDDDVKLPHTRQDCRPSNERNDDCVACDTRVYDRDGLPAYRAVAFLIFEVLRVDGCRKYAGAETYRQDRDRV